MYMFVIYINAHRYNGRELVADAILIYHNRFYDIRPQFRSRSLTFDRYLFRFAFSGF